MQPDGLQQSLRWRVVFVSQNAAIAGVQPPLGVKVR